MVGVLSFLSIVYRILANGTVDEPIILNGDDRLKDGDDGLDTRPGPRTLNSGQPSNDASYLETPPVLPNRTANKRDSEEAAAEPNKPPDPAGHGPWWDVEDGGYIDDDLRPIPLLEQEGLASTPA
jgi:hypothetical protein